MSSPQLILDTDILSLPMRKNAAVLVKASAYPTEYHQFTISIITRYEILRGLKAKDALKQVERTIANVNGSHAKRPVLRRRARLKSVRPA